MEKILIDVPNEVNYLSDWEGFKFPNGILNKVITGCGATELALTNDIPTIVACPRNALLQNKHAQHPSTTITVNVKVIEEEIEYFIKQQREKGIVPKILTTYDSLYKVVNAIGVQALDKWHLVIDEFQCVILDSAFKSEVEIAFLNICNLFAYKTYLSATPLLDEYIEKVEGFKDLPFYLLNWGADKIEKPNIHMMPTNKPINLVADIINKMYKVGKYPTYGEVVSNEVVIYLNSVKNICKLIKECKLKPDEVNIICASKVENDDLLKQLGKKYEVGAAPLKGEKHKKYTFCTSTAFFGVDFYSDCATNVVVNDCYTPTSIVDIATELPQICGRERNNNNPFRNFVIFVYNKNRSNVKEDEIKLIFKEKEDKTQQEIIEYNGLSRNLHGDIIKMLKANKYKNSYTMYNPTTLQFEFNRMAEVVDRYNSEVRQHNFTNGILIKKAIADNGFEVNKSNYINYQNQIETAVTAKTFADEMKAYMEWKNSEDKDTSIRHKAEIIDIYDALGESKIKALKYSKKKCLKAIKDGVKIDSFEKPLFLKVGDVIPVSKIKDDLQQLYKKNKIEKAAKATDLKKWYNCTFKQKSIKGIITAVVVINE